MPTKLLILAVTVNAVVAQLFLKRALAVLATPSSFADLPRFILDAAKSPWVYTSIAIQGIGYILWMIVVSRIKLGVAAASTSAGFYILAALAAWAFYGEVLNSLQWLGICLVTIGVICISLGPVWQ